MMYIGITVEYAPTQKPVKNLIIKASHLKLSFTKTIMIHEINIKRAVIKTEIRRPFLLMSKLIIGPPNIQANGAKKLNSEQRLLLSAKPKFSDIETLHGLQNAITRPCDIDPRRKIGRAHV